MGPFLGPHLGVPTLGPKVGSPFWGQICAPQQWAQIWSYVIYPSGVPLLACFMRVAVCKHLLITLQGAEALRSHVSVNRSAVIHSLRCSAQLRYKVACIARIAVQASFHCVAAHFCAQVACIARIAVQASTHCVAAHFCVKVACIARIALQSLIHCDAALRCAKVACIARFALNSFTQPVRCSAQKR